MTLPVVPPVRPMLAKVLPGVPDQPPGAPAWVYEPKWDGFRAIVFRDGDDVVLTSRTGKEMQRYFPEVVAAAWAELPDRCVVDGEIVVATTPGGGAARLDFELLAQRIHPAGSRVRMLAEQVPASLVVFDVLAEGDADLRSTPLRERLEVLDAFALSGPGVHATPRTTDAGQARAWFETFEGAGLDGVVAKRLDGVYEHDKRVLGKVKHARTADVVLAGMREHKTSTPERPAVGSLLLGLYDDAGHLQFVGAASAFSAARRVELYAELAPLVVAPGSGDHPWDSSQDDAGSTGTERRPGAPSRWSSGKSTSFDLLRVERVAEVGYDHMEGARFRHTVQLKRWRPDRDPASCTYDQLEEPVGYDLAEILPGAPGVTDR